MNRSSLFDVNEFVWAKVTGYSYWPAIVTEPDPLAPVKPQDDTHWIYFFGSHNYAWVQEKHIKPYREYKDKYSHKCSQSVLKAYKELKEHKKQIKNDPLYKIDFVKFILREPRIRSGSARSRSGSSMSNSSSGSRRRRRADSDTSGSTISRKRSKSALSSGTYESVDQGFKTITSLKNPGIKIFKKPVGVLACNIYAEAIAKNLIGMGHNVVIWSPSQALCFTLQKYANANSMGSYFKTYPSVRQLVKNAALIFSCFSSTDEAKAHLLKLGLSRKNDRTLAGKIYVETTIIDSETSIIFEHYLARKGAGYIEAMMDGTVQDVEDRDMTIFVGGSPTMMNELETKFKSCFCALGKSTQQVGEVGVASKVHLITQMIKAVCLAGFVEAVALVDQCGDLIRFLDSFQVSPFYSKYFDRVCNNIRNTEYSDIQETLRGLQQDLDQILEMSNKYKLSLPMASTAHQLYKHARRLGYDDLDSSSMYVRARY